MASDLNLNSLLTPETNQAASQSISTSVAQMDDLVKEYLLYRGFNFTFKAFEQEVKLDKDKSFKADKITDQLLAYIHSYDLNSLLEYWSFLEQKYFSRLVIRPIQQNNSTALSRKYELFLLRYYLIYAIQTSKNEKAAELFENYASKLKSQHEWKEWYCLPFLKNPEENPTFSVYFSKNWIDTFIISLQNFLNIVVQSVQSPRLLNYEEDAFWNRQSNQTKNSNNYLSSSFCSMNNLLNVMNFEQDFLQNEITDEIQQMQISQTNKQPVTFISMIKNITNNSKQKANNTSSTTTSATAASTGLSNIIDQ